MKNPIKLFIAVLSAWPAAFAATEFSAEQVLFINNPPLYAFAAELDAAGPDLIIGGEAGLSIMFGQVGAGDFGPRQQLGSTRSESDQVADLDGDGDFDILSVQVPGSRRAVVWYRNDGGEFSPAIEILSANSSVTILQPTDADGDDDLDLILYDSRDGIIEWMENSDGEGDFAPGQTIGTVENMVFPVLADLNGDEIADFVGQDWKRTGLASDDELVWIPGQMAGVLSFGVPQVIAGSGTSRLAHGKLDEDEMVDLIVSGSPAGTMLWMKGTGGGGFAPPAPIATLPTTPQNVSIVDLDGDGFADVLASTRFGDAEFCRNSDGAGSFAPPAPLASPSVSTFESLVAADLTGDLRRDLITVEETGVSLRVQAPAATEFAPPVVLASAVDDITDVTAADVDGDTRPDILFSSQDGKLQVLPNLDAGQFGDAVLLLDEQDDLEVILPVQIDGQDGVDLILLRPEDDLALWRAGDGAGGFGAQRLIDNFGFDPSAAAVADFNADGSPDVAVAFSGDDACSWYSQNPATHAFSFHSLGGSISGTRAVAAGDVDGDDDPDIVTAGFDGQIYVYTNNNGTGSFSGAALVGTAPAGTDQVELADIDGDSDLDILARESSGVDSTITAFINDGGGAFPAMRNLYTSGSGLKSMAIGDLDSDGDFDIVTANGSSRSVHWHENDGGGNFTVAALMPDAISSPYTVDLHDMDDDGDLDVLNVSRFAGIVGWFRNDFTPPPPNDDPVTVWAWDRGVVEPEVLDLASDGDGDGYTLLEEFAFNMDPTTADRSVAQANGDSGPPQMWFTFGSNTRARGILIRRKGYAEIGLSYTVELGGDLVTWTEASIGNGVSVNPDYRRITYNKLVSGKPPNHAQRVRIEYNPPGG